MKKKNIDKCFLFFTIRILDLFSTWIVINKYGGGASVEGNPFYKYIIGNYGYIDTIIINLSISMALYYLTTKLKPAYKFIVAGMGLVVIWNFGVYVLI